MTRSSNLTEATYVALKKKIANNEFPVGLRLPSEQDLCKEFSVSRTVIRNAISRLRDEDVLKTIRGSGAFVVESPKSLKSKSLENNRVDFEIQSMADVMVCQEVRMLYEGELAHLAARRWTEADMTKMESALESMVGDDPHSLGTVEEDLYFHTTIMLASHNDFGIRIYEAMKPQILIGMNMVRGLYNLLPEVAVKGGLKEHEAILNLIRERNADGVRDAMHNHISYFTPHLQQYSR